MKQKNFNCVWWHSGHYIKTNKRGDYIKTNKKFQAIIKELFIRCRKLDKVNKNDKD